VLLSGTVVEGGKLILRKGVANCFSKSGFYIERKKREKKRKKTSNELCREANTGNAYAAPGNFWTRRNIA